MRGCYRVQELILPAALLLSGEAWSWADTPPASQPHLTAFSPGPSPVQLVGITREEGVTLRAALAARHHGSGASAGTGSLKAGALGPCEPEEEDGCQFFRGVFNRAPPRPAFSQGIMPEAMRSWRSCIPTWKSAGGGGRAGGADPSGEPQQGAKGDTLLTGGCGQIFEGTAEQMYKNLAEVLGALPQETKVFCEHEYTARNLKFALKVEPEHEIVKAKLREDEDLPTVPSTLADEFLYNPFLQVLEEPVQRFTGKVDPTEVVAALCKARDSSRKPRERLSPQATLALELGLFDPLLEKK